MSATYPTINADNLAHFRNSVLDLAKVNLIHLDDDVFLQFEDILQDNISDSELELDNYVDEYDEDFTKDEDIVNTLQDRIQDLADVVREQEDFIHESVDSSSVMIYPSEYQDFYMENTRECHEAINGYGCLGDFESIDSAMQFSVYLVLCNALREDFESLADWLEDFDVIDAL